MIRKFLSWIKGDDSEEEISDERLYHTAVRIVPPRPVPRAPVPRHGPEAVELDPAAESTIESGGPGKNVLVRSRFVREDTGTHETLKIVDDSLIDSGEEPGIDPYNTGSFDRSRNWDKRRR